MSAARDYSHEDWIPWYTRDTAGWLELSLAARGAAEGIARKMGRDREELHLGSRGLRGLARTLGCSWEELEPALHELLSPGPDGEPPRLVYDQARCVLRDPDASRRRRRTSTERVRSYRKAKPEPVPDETTETHETVSPVSSTVETGVTVPSYSYSDLISSGSDPEAPVRPPAARAISDPADPEPEWWPDVLATIHQGTQVLLPARESWLRYAGHRSLKRLPAERGDAVHWLTTVMVKEAREARERARQQADRDARYDRQRGGPEPPKPAPTAEQAKANAERLAERIAARKAREPKGAA